MKKLTFLTAILLALPIIGFGQNVNIPDANFKAYLVGNSAINTNGDNQIQVSEASAFNGTINVNNLNINSLIGIEAFVSLNALYCVNNVITNLDLSGCTSLTFLALSSNSALTSLDVSNCTALTTLYCSNNALTSLDASGCIALTTLNCPNSQLTSLDVTNCTALTELNCSTTANFANGQLTSLDVSTCTALTSLVCSNNALTSLDVSNCTALILLWCSDNPLTSIDITTNTALTTLYCWNNQLTSLDVSACTALTELNCSGNELTSLDVSSNTALTTLYCSFNELTSLIVSANTALTSLGCGNNQLTTLDVSACSALTSLDCSGNELTCLNVNNGNNINWYIDSYYSFSAENNPNLSCIEVDDVAWSNANLANNIDSTASFSLNCNCSGAGISDINESNTLILYPNPTNGDFTITGLELVGTVSSLSLTDMHGKVVKVLDTKATKFSMASIKPGVYFLNIISGIKQEVLKIVKE
jgi:Leucine-rich repeat (LRR) protein